MNRPPTWQGREGRDSVKILFAAAEEAARVIKVRDRGGFRFGRDGVGSD